MKFKFIYPWLIGLFACLFVSLQTSAVAHAVSHLDSPHEHNGLVCDTGAIAEDSAGLLSTDALVQTYTPEYTEVFISAYISAPRLTPPGRAPPGRSPPTLF